jgi:hypothetical protein
MSGFLTELCLVDADGQDDGKWILGAPLVYQSDVAKTTFTVPAGFKTDLASVPRLPVIYWLCGDTSSKAAVVHDYLYTTGAVPREVADAVLREASGVTGVPWWRRTLMYWGVRIGGASHYTPQSQAEAA